MISHPFFSLAAHLQSLARRYRLDVNGEFLESVKKQYLSCWLDKANPDELGEIYNNILKLLPIYSALALFRLQRATNNASKEKQNWFIKGHLQKML